MQIKQQVMGLLGVLCLMMSCQGAPEATAAKIKSIDVKEYDTEERDFFQYHVTGFWRRHMVDDAGQKEKRFAYVVCSDIPVDFHPDLAVENNEERQETLNKILNAQHEYESFTGFSYPMFQIVKKTDGLCQVRDQELNADQLAQVAAYIKTKQDLMAPADTVKNYRLGCSTIVVGGVYANLAWFLILYHEFNNEASVCNKSTRYRLLRQFSQDMISDTENQLTAEETPALQVGTDIDAGTKVGRLTFDAVRRVIDNAVAVSLGEEPQYADPTFELDQTQQMQRSNR